jgi:hypothetical protein
MQLWGGNRSIYRRFHKTWTQARKRATIRNMKWTRPSAQRFLYLFNNRHFHTVVSISTFYTTLAEYLPQPQFIAMISLEPSVKFDGTWVRLEWFCGFQDGFEPSWSRSGGCAARRSPEWIYRGIRWVSCTSKFGMNFEGTWLRSMGLRDWT